MCVQHVNLFVRVCCAFVASEAWEEGVLFYLGQNYMEIPKGENYMEIPVF